MSDAITVVHEAPPSLESGDPWLAMITAIATNPAVDIARIEQLYALKVRSDNAKAMREFGAAMAAAQSEMAPVVKQKVNTHTSTKYADLASIADAVQPIYAKHGFALTFSVGQDSTQAEITIICDVVHAGGHSNRTSLRLPLDAAGSAGKINKTALQAHGSTITYGRRYLTCMVFNIATADNADNDGNAPRPQSAPVPVTDEQAALLRKWIETTQSDLKVFLAYFRANSITEFPAAKFDSAIAALKRKQVQQ